MDEVDSGGLEVGYGKRIRQLRIARDIPADGLGVSRSYLTRIELEDQHASLGAIERMCESLHIGMGRLFADERKFDDMMVLEDRFVLLVLPFLKRLTAKQKNEVLAAMATAPKQEPAHLPYVHTEHRTSYESRKSTTLKASSTNFPTSKIRYLPSVRSPMMDGCKRELF